MESSLGAKGSRVRDAKNPQITRVSETGLCLFSLQMQLWNFQCVATLSLVVVADLSGGLRGALQVSNDSHVAGLTRNSLFAKSLRLPSKQPQPFAR